MEALSFVLLTLGVLAFVVIMMIRSARKAAAQQRAHEMRLQAMARATAAAAARKAQAAAGSSVAAPETPPQAVSGAIREERECPFCAEPILKKARFCKHCRRDVEPLQ
jgi:type II secretory pathway component PulM